MKTAADAYALALVNGSWNRSAVHEDGEVAPGVCVSPHRLGGKPCLTGTRLSTEQVASMMRDYGREFIRQGWPYLTDEQIQTACDYEAGR